MNNQLATHFRTYFQMAAADASALAGSFGLMNLFARSLGGITSDLLFKRFGFRGRIWAQFLSLFFEAVFLFCFGLVDNSQPWYVALAVLLCFSLFVQMAEGTSYGIVPFMNRQQLAIVSALVGAGGNLGAVIAGFGFYRPIEDCCTASAIVSSQVRGLFSEKSMSRCFISQDQWRQGPLSSEEAQISAAQTLLSSFPIFPNFQWQQPSLAEFQAALKKVQGAAGPDAWSPEELQFLPGPAILVLYQLQSRWGQADTLPEQLLESRQANLPKPHKVANGVVKAADTRPIAVLSVFWRAVASSWEQCEAMQSWRQMHFPRDTVAGGKNHLGAEDVAAQIQDCLAAGRIAVSLDYSRCYDSMSPAVSALLLEGLGFPRALVTLIRKGWGQSRRWLTWNQHIHPVRLNASQSTPQGCPLAPFLLQLWMLAGHRFVQERIRILHGERLANKGVTKIYMDDRTCVEHDWQMIESRVARWAEWSARVGLTENQRKIQVGAKSKQLKLILQQHAPADWIKQELRVLGTTTNSRGRRADDPEETSRLQRARSRALLLDAAKLPTDLLLKHARTFVLPLCTYGWTGKIPTIRAGDALFNKLTVATHTARMANRELRMVVYGASLHLDALWGTRAFARVTRLRQFGTVWANQAATSVGLLRRWMRKHQWQETGPWAWTNHHGTRIRVGANQQQTQKALHEIRQHWRRQHFVKWVDGSRHEAAQLKQASGRQALLDAFERVDLQALRKSFEAGTGAQRAILLGAAVSPAWLARSNPGDPHNDGSCLWCDCPGFLRHLLWDCLAFPGIRSRPPAPANPLQHRLAWPVKGRNRALNDRILRHAGDVLAAIWSHRHGRNPG